MLVVDIRHWLDEHDDLPRQPASCGATPCVSRIPHIVIRSSAAS
jgi:hypothetical protein